MGSAAWSLFVVLQSLLALLLLWLLMMWRVLLVLVK
jgi:hypothetical protein